ncbi:unnamed protein product [Tenebrio molitor]|nr:unnamed protein product [Tenebrio molitor]
MINCCFKSRAAPIFERVPANTIVRRHLHPRITFCNQYN